MIRTAEPRDQPDLDRLAIAQFTRTPWPEGRFEAVTDIHVCERLGRVAGCVGFQRCLTGLFVVHCWVEDGFSGQRAAVDLLTDLRNLADCEGMDLTFVTAPWNRGLRAAVEKYGCESGSADERAVFYRRRAERSNEGRWSSRAGLQ